MRVAPWGDTGLRIEFGPGDGQPGVARARRLAEALADDPPPGLVEAVPAFGTVTVFYDRRRVADFAAWCDSLVERAEALATEPDRGGGREYVIPVCYAREWAPDLDQVAARAGLSAAEVVARHSAAEYRVAAVGFTPGFPYLSGLPAALHTPRRATPRAVVPAGSVGIGGNRTGIYPLASPGGWNLIGRTPLTLFNPRNEPPALLGVGDRVRFQAITEEELAAWK